MPGLKCKKCGGPHVTIKCGKTNNNLSNNNLSNNNLSNNNLNNNFNKNNFNKNNFNKNNFNKNNFNKNNQKYCIKISNIPDDLTIKELADLMCEWGNIGKINFNNNILNKSAYIDFYIKEEAEYFVQALDKTPFDNYIINVELLER